MNKKDQKPQTKRFVEVFNMLIKGGNVNSAAEFCNEIDFLASSLSSVIKGRRDIPLLAINSTCKRYGINRNYILDGTGPVFVSDPNQGNVVSEAPAQYGNSAIMELKDLEIKHLKEKCALYEQEIEYLKSMLTPLISNKHPSTRKVK